MTPNSMVLATRAQVLADCPIGLYQVTDSERRVEKYFDPETNADATGPTVEYARVFEVGTEPPKGVEDQEVRPDGHLVVFCRGCAPEADGEIPETLLVYIGILPGDATSPANAIEGVFTRITRANLIAMTPLDFVNTIAFPAFSHLQQKAKERQE